MANLNYVWPQETVNIDVTGITYPADVFDQIWCQVTMVNAYHGDCNVIDVNLDEHLDFRNRARIIIDTGTGLETLDVARALGRVIRYVGVPILETSTQAAVVPKTNVIQITHTDEDHAGNVLAILRAMRNNQNFRERFEGINPGEGPVFSYTKLLDATPQFEVTLGDANPDFVHLKYEDVTNGWIGIECREILGNEWLHDAKELQYKPKYWFGAKSYNTQQDLYNAVGQTPAAQLGFPLKLTAPDGYRGETMAHNYHGRWQLPLNLFDAPHPWVLVTCTIRFERLSKYPGTSRITGYVPVGIGMYGDTSGPYDHTRGYTGDPAAGKKAWERARFKGVLPSVELRILTAFCYMNNPGGGYDFISREDMLGERRAATRNWLADDTFYGNSAIYHQIPKYLESVNAAWQALGALNVQVVPLEAERYWQPGRYPYADVVLRGPTFSTIQELRGDALARAFRNLTHNPNKVDWDVNDDGLANRASIITAFDRCYPAPNSNVHPHFRMLFTGDAYDKHCNVRDTIVNWAEYEPEYLNVMKVPHHGSDVTADVEFYNHIRARVYLVCGKESKNGSPSYEALRTIVETMIDKPNEQHLIFFSDPECLQPIKKTVNDVVQSLHLSNVAKVLINYRPRDDAYPNYKCYRLARAMAGQANKGTIIFGAKDGVFEVYFRQFDAANNTGEWVEVTYDQAVQVRNNLPGGGW